MAVSAFALKRRSLALLLAIVLAGLATVALVSYVRGLENDARAGLETVNVFVAKEDIPAGMPADVALARGFIERQAVPRAFVNDGTVLSLSAISGLQTTTTILQGEALQAGRFVAPSEAAGLLPIPEGRQAMSLAAATPPAVGGFVQPGDRVSVLAKIDVQEQATNKTTTTVRFLLQDVPVLAVGARVVTPAAAGTDEATADQSQDTILLTLAVTPADAEKLGYALLDGEIYFTLLPKGQGAAKTPGRTSTNAFS